MTAITHDAYLNLWDLFSITYFRYTQSLAGNMAITYPAGIYLSYAYDLLSKCPIYENDAEDIKKYIKYALSFI